MTDMSYLFNSMVNFNADISALGVTGHIRVYVMDMLFYVPTNITRLDIGCNPPGNNTGLPHLWNLSVPSNRVVQSESCKVVSRPSVCSALSLSSAEADAQSSLYPLRRHTHDPTLRPASQPHPNPNAHPNPPPPPQPHPNPHPCTPSP